MNTHQTIRLSLRHSRAAFLLCAALLFCFPVRAQQGNTSSAAPASHGPALTLPFFVLSKDEEPVKTLTRDDVTIQEDGHPETVEAVNKAASEPLSVAILFDTRSNFASFLDKNRPDLERFLDQLLPRPQDKAAVIDFNDDAGLDLALTPGRDKIKTAIDKLKVRPAGAYETTADDKNLGGNVLFDALFLASDEVLKSQPGRKAVIVLTDGIDRGSKESILSAIEAAQRANAVIYTIEIPVKEKDEPSANRDNAGQTPGTGQQGGNYPGGNRGGGGGYPGSYPGGGSGYPGGRRNTQRPPSPTRKDSKKVLLQMSADSGGHYYEISPKFALNQAFDKIAAQLQSEYLLTYYLNKDDREEGFHHLSWSTKDKSQLLQAAPGFYADRP